MRVRIARRPEPEPPTWVTVGNAHDDGLIFPRDDVAEFRRRWLDDMQARINQLHQRREAAERTYGFYGR